MLFSYLSVQLGRLGSITFQILLQSHQSFRFGTIAVIGTTRTIIWRPGFGYSIPATPNIFIRITKFRVNFILVLLVISALNNFVNAIFKMFPKSGLSTQD